MSINVSTWSIRNPVPTSLLFILLTVVGVWGYARMKVQNFPDIDFPIVTVTAVLPGASPPQLENDVARKIEDSLANLQGLKHIKSTLTDGVATITAEFEVDKSSQEAMDQVRDAVSRTRSRLPADLLDPVIAKVELASEPVVTYAVASTRLDDEALSWLVDNQVTKKLLGLPGVGAVSRVGGANREIRVELEPDRLLALNTTAAEVSGRLRLLQLEASGGRANLGGLEQPIRAIGTVATAGDIAGLPLPLGDGRNFRIDQIAAVRDATAERRSMALLDGRTVVAFDVLRSRGAGEIEVADAVQAAIRELQSRYPAVQFVEAVNRVDPIAENYEGSMSLLYEGAALAVLVVFCFLRDWRATLIAAVALPLSAIPTFAAMQLLGFTLNTVSLLSLSLVVGVLVDDAIVEIENIERHLLMGKTPMRAAADAAEEIGLAVIATTFTLMAVFLPTSLMSGTVGQYFIQFGWTAAIAVFFSLVVARMLTPTLAAYFLKAPEHFRRRPRWLGRYLLMVRVCLRHRALTSGTAALIVAIGLCIPFWLPGEFMPPDDSDQTEVTVSLPPGSTLAQTLALAEQARAIVSRQKHVRSVYTAIGKGGETDGPGSSSSAADDVTKAVLTVKLVPRSARGGITRQSIEAALRKRLEDVPGARVAVGASEGSEAYSLVLASEDGQLLARHAAVVERELRAIPGVGAVTSSASLVRPELVVRPDPARAAELGVSLADIADTLRVATTGDYQQDLAKLNASERQVPVVVKLADAARADLDLLKKLPVPGAGGPVPLESVASLELLTGPAELTRYDRLRNVSLGVQLNGRPLSEVEAAVGALPSVANLPSGVMRKEAGDAEAMGELVTGFSMAMMAGVLCIYMVLVLLLGDFVQPVTVLFALVLSVPGAFFALALTGTSLSMPSMIGLIMLMGIATKNSILLVDYIVLARRDHGLGKRQAIMDACRKRARPIVMTTIAMGAGMTPIALGLGADPSFRAPMAIVVVGGLITSTVLSLLVIPIVYSYVDDAEAYVRRRLKSGVSARGGKLLAGAST